MEQNRITKILDKFGKTYKENEEGFTVFGVKVKDYKESTSSATVYTINYVMFKIVDDELGIAYAVEYNIDNPNDCSKGYTTVENLCGSILEDIDKVISED